MEFEKQLSEKNAIINYSTMQLIPQSQDKTICNWSHNNNHKNKIKKDKDNDTQLEKEDPSNKAVILGDSILNNINGRRLSKTKKVDLLNFPGLTSTDILMKIDDVLDKKPKSIFIYVGTNDHINDVKLLSNLKKIFSKTNRTSPNTALSFSNNFRKDQENTEKKRADTNSQLNNFCKQKNICLLLKPGPGPWTQTLDPDPGKPGP